VFKGVFSLDSRSQLKETAFEHRVLNLFSLFSSHFCSACVSSLKVRLSVPELLKMSLEVFWKKRILFFDHAGLNSAL
jgi:hypothetical protein